MKRAIFVAAVSLAICVYGTVQEEGVHPAEAAAVKMIAAKAPEGLDIVLRLEKGVTDGDGYTARRAGDTITILGKRPRSFLFAAGEAQRWLSLADGEELKRESPFKRRILNFTGQRHSIAEWVAATGVNAVQLSRRAPARLVDECHAADVECYGFLYGCDPSKWGKAKCEEFLAANPSARATDPGRSWEKGVMCPSDKKTWEYCASVITDLAKSAPYDGIVVTFWDDYGLNCHCKRCKASGNDKFSAQVAGIVKCFEEALSNLGKKLIVRTWSSGCPHFLVDEWVHAPGYGGTGGEPLALWGETFAGASRSTIIQTKVYNCDCQPGAPFSLLLGEAKKQGLEEYAEWQITGQTVGLGWLPSPVVDDTAWRMKKAFSLVHGDGVCLYAGGYNNRDYEALDDIANSVNIYAWRQLSWDPEEDVKNLWREWAHGIYGEEAADEICQALALCEKASVVSFSPLGLGAPTESRFTSNVKRREDLLRYTNRCHLEEGRRALEPTEENIARVVAEKDEALASVEKAKKLVESAASKAKDAKAWWSEELLRRLSWLETHLRCTRAIDGALWRLRRLEYLLLVSASDRSLLEAIDADFETVRANHKKLFEHTPELKLSFYPTPCLDRDISLRSPVPIMRDIRSNAVYCVEKILGPQEAARRVQ